MRRIEKEQEALYAKVSMIKYVLDIPNSMFLKGETLLNPSTRERKIRITLEIPVEEFSSLIKKWMSWKKAYKYRKR